MVRCRYRLVKKSRQMRYIEYNMKAQTLGPGVKMNIIRRHLGKRVRGLPLAAATVAGIPPLVAAAESMHAEAPAPGGPITLPDKGNFVFEGVHLNAAYTHPTG